MTFQPGWGSGRVGDWAEAVLAANPGPLTLDGTNTWIVQRPGSEQATVVDPGPDDEAHLAAVLAATRARGARVTTILLTHHHVDHTEGAAHLADVTGARLLGAEHGWGPVDDIEVFETPGHTADSVCLLLPQANLLLTGDTVLGRGTSVIAGPDGRLDAYLTTLDRLAGIVDEHALTRLLPGHGPVLEDAAATVEEYRTHRRARLDQVRAAVAAGAGTAREVVEVVYADVPKELWPAAELSVQAQLDYLSSR